MGIEVQDFHNGAGSDEVVCIEVAFSFLPNEIELEEGRFTTFEDEMLVDANGYLRIVKTYSYDSEAPYIYENDTYLITYDFKDDNLAGLASLNRNELINLCRSNNINIGMFGPMATNKSKREVIRAKAIKNNHQKVEKRLSLNRNLR